MSTTETMKAYPTAVAMSAITGAVVHLPFSDVHEALTHMAGESVWTHQLPRVSREAQAVMLALRPDLAPAIEEAKTITPENVNDVLAIWLARYGETIDLPVMTGEQHKSVGPVSEMAEMRGGWKGEAA